MPTTPYAKILVSVDGGPNQDGGIDVPSGANIQFSPESTVGWLRARWEIYDYPEGWGTPSGWTLAADGTIYSTDFTPDDIDLPDNGAMFGVWMPRLLVNEQIDNDQDILGNLLDDTTALCMPSPSGLRDMGARESTQFTTTATRIKGWLRSYQRNLRALENPAITLTTTNATPALIRRYPVANGTTRAIRAIVRVQNADATKHAEYEVKGGYKRVAGTLAQIYAPTVTTIFETDAGLDVGFTLNGDTDVDLEVTGLAATVLSWSASEMFL